MYCVIQKIERRKPNTYGASKELEAYVSYTRKNGINKYGYRHTGGKFERPIKTAYRVSIHESKRINGVVTKKQYAVTTVGYYDLVEYGIYDCVSPPKVKELTEKLNISEDKFWDLLFAKIDPLQAKITAEFEQTDEYKTASRHREIIGKYTDNKAEFNKKYGFTGDIEYDCCYDVFGNVINQNYLNEIIQNYEKQQRSYGKSEYSNYSNYFNLKSNNYTDTERSYLKKIYRILSKQFHPDNVNGDGNIMRFINDKLKKEWEI